MDAISAHRLKLRRARKHLNALEYQMRKWRSERAPDAFTIDSKADGETTFTYHGAPDPPPSWGLLIGDCLHNLRSCLDLLAFDLARSHTGVLSERQAAASEFPIFGNRPMSDAECGRKIGCIGPQAKAFIKGLQPHLRGDEFTADPLWLLHVLSITDKHRLILFAVTSGGLIRVRGRNLGGIDAGEVRAGGVNPGATGRAYSFTLRPINASNPMDVAYDPLVSITFCDGLAQGKEVIPALRGLYKYVERSVVAPLETFL